jgi:cytochrome c oxidase assembly protein subunit 15
MRLPERLVTVSPTVFRRAARLSVVLLALIVVTGGAVRLTGSGLGCPTWPRCGDGSFVTRSQYAAHGWIEFGNRMITIAVGVVMLVMPLLALRLRDSRRDLVRLSFGLWAGFLGQVVLGGLTVLFDLNPALVAGHFLLSMLLLLDVIVLDRRARQGPGPVRPAVRAELLWLARLLAAAAGAVLVLGTVVTGTGPHSGDSAKARRFGFDLTTVAQLHADGAMLLVGLSVAMVFAVRVAVAPPEARWAANGLAASVVAQAAIGFAQYFSGIPVGLVALHIAGATVMWFFALRVWLALSERPPAAGPTAAEHGNPHAAPAPEPALL